MKTNNGFLLGVILVSAAALGLSAPAFAQSDSQKSANPANQGKPAPKPHKVWTEDDFGSHRSPAEAKDKQAAQAAASQQPAAENHSSTSKQAQKAGPPPVLTNPKSLDDADRMIAWENRDIAAQEEFLVQLKQELDEAPADQKERLAKLLADRTQILANTRNELQNLQTKKRELEKSAARSVVAAVEPPSQ